MNVKLFYLCRNEGRKKIRMGIIGSNPIAIKKESTITVGKIEYIFITIADVPEKIMGIDATGVMYDEPAKEFPSDTIALIHSQIRRTP